MDVDTNYLTRNSLKTNWWATLYMYVLTQCHRMCFICIDSFTELHETPCKRLYMHECECKTCERWETQQDQSIFEIIHKYIQKKNVYAV